MSRPEPRSHSDDGLSSAKVATARANIGAGRDTVRNLNAVVMVDNILDGDDGIGPLGNNASGRDRHRLTRTELPRRGSTRRNAEDNRQLARRVGDPDREPVHRGARERGQVDEPSRSLGEHSSTGRLERNLLGRKRLNALEDKPLRLVNRRKLGHDRRIRYARRIGSAAVISVVVPVHNEERTLGLLYEELESALEPQDEAWEVVFVDDGSTDGSFAALTRLHNARANVRVVRLRRNFGKATALATGFAQAQGDVVVTIDADLQDDPAEIPRLLAKLDEGFDLVSGWKARRRDPLSRRVPSRIFNWVTGRVSGLRLHDLNCGLKAYRAEVVRGLRLYGELHRFIPVLAHYRGHRIAELPVNHRPREHGGSRYGVERYLRGFLDLLTVSFIGRYRYRPLHLFGGLGLVLGLVGFAVLVYLTVLKLDGHAIGQRPLLILGVLLVVVGLQFFSLGLISELITSQHEERAGTRERTELHVEEILP
jgi:dolichol-phosphate mannosyltransferase